MKKIKISELPLYQSLQGLFTIGTDENNRSVKVSLEFVEEETNRAVSNAEAAATAALTAKAQTESATSDARTATQEAQTATTQSATQTAAALTATNNANAAAQAAQTARQNAETATQAANNATQQTLSVKEQTETVKQQAETATEEANAAAANALTVKIDIQAMLDRLVPTGLTVKAPERLTIGNTRPVFIQADLTPTDALKNIIFISDNRAVEVSTLGQLRVVSEGKSVVSVIPTCNTALAKTILIEVGKPTARLNTSRSLRLTSGGGFLLT